MAAAVGTAIMILAVAGALGWANARPRRHPGFEDLRNPLAEAWSPDSRVEHGWPLPFHRRFDRPSPVNVPGRWDRLALLLDLCAWLGLLLLPSVPWVTWRLLASRRHGVPS
jgi:hypothetical protein